jgi:hypothetical protein
MRKLEVSRQTLSLKSVQWVRQLDIIYLDIHIIPILNTNSRLLGAILTFVDVTQRTSLEHDV